MRRTRLAGVAKLPESLSYGSVFPSLFTSCRGIANLARTKPLSSVKVQAAIRLLEEIQEPLVDLPADEVASIFFRKNRELFTPIEKRESSRLTFDVMRVWDALGWWLARMRKEIPELSKRFGVSPRLRVLAYMVLKEKWGEIQVKQHFEKLTPLEEALVEKLQGNSLTDPSMPPWLQLYLPEHMHKELIAFYGPERLKAEMAALNMEAPLDLRVNTLKTTREALIEELAAAGVKNISKTPISPVGLRIPRGEPLSASVPFKVGNVYVQDEGSQLISLLVRAKPSLIVLDYCAGAGGKTLGLGIDMQNKGKIIGTDVSEVRLQAAKRRLRLAGIRNFELRPLVTPHHSEWRRKHKNAFSRVLLDVPCSGSGAWRRHPDIKLRVGETDHQNTLQTQAFILEEAKHFVSPKGLLVYSTCSLLPSENEEQVEKFLKANPEFSPVSVPKVWKDLQLPPLKPQASPYLRLSPAEHGTDGFFVSILQRNISSFS